MAQSRKAGQTYRFMLLLSIFQQNFTIKVSANVTTTSLVYEGYPVQLQCVCSSYNRTWKYFTNTYDRQGELIYHYENVTGRFRGHFNVDSNGTESLSFLKNENVSVQDTGYYTCYCDDKNTVSETLLQVVPNGYPKCSVRSNNGKLIVKYRKVGQSVILTCDSGFDSNYPTIRWMREERQLPVAFSVNDNTVLEETIKLTEKDMDVTYTCILGYGSVMSTFSCSVMPFIYRPRVNIYPKVMIKNVGENVTLNCSVSLENKPALSTLIYAWNETNLDKFSGRFVLGNENRSLQLLGLKYSDDMTALYCRVTVIRTGAQDRTVALLRVNGSGMSTTPLLGPYTSTKNYSTAFISTNSTPVNFDTSRSEFVTKATPCNSFCIYLGITLVIIFAGVVILFLYTLYKRRTNSRNGSKRCMLSITYGKIKPKIALKSKSSDQLVCGIVRPSRGKNSFQCEEVPDYELNNVTFCSTGIINSEKSGRKLGEQNYDTPANRIEERHELMKSESPCAYVKENKFTGILQSLGDQSIGRVSVGERTRDTAPMYATLSKR